MADDDRQWRTFTSPKSGLHTGSRSDQAMGLDRSDWTGGGTGGQIPIVMRRPQIARSHVTHQDPNHLATLALPAYAHAVLTGTPCPFGQYFPAGRSRQDVKVAPARGSRCAIPGKSGIHGGSTVGSCFTTGHAICPSPPAAVSGALFSHYRPDNSLASRPTPACGESVGCGG